MRASGILLPIFSLPSKYGIGCFSKEAYKFADQLKEAGQSYWQILPLGPTGYGDSPYQSFSTFAGNPYFIDLETLIEEGLLTGDDCDKADFGDDENTIDYARIYNEREGLLRKAFSNSDYRTDSAYAQFKEEENGWLHDYALYTAIKASFNNISWLKWDTDIRQRSKTALSVYEKILADEMEFYSYTQFLFYKQWKKLKAYVNGLGIKFIGDIPIYVAMDSADTWACPALFQFDDFGNPTAQAGVPPDGFSATGQLWGNPLYDWEYHKKTDFAWWKKRYAHQAKLYDVIRIDHFRGLDEYYSVPIADTTAENGRWEKGPGIALIDALREEMGEIRVIAEDLGYLTDTVLKLVSDSGFPGMKVLQFAFDSRESANYLPHTYVNNCVVYTGTHDNDTTLSWYHKFKEEDRNYALEYLGRASLSEDEITWTFIRLAMSSVADTCIIPLQDYLSLGSEARINTPATLGSNWKWRLTGKEIDYTLVKKIREMTRIYGRCSS